MKKTILITGSTDGIGKLAALKLAKNGHEVYLHGRSADKLKTVLSEIKSQSTNENISGFIADFSDFEAVKKMAGQIKNDLPKIDVLINNAGVYKSAKATNKDGLDMRLVVNYLAPYLLTKELLPLLRKSEAPRLINLSSAAQAPVSLEVLAGKTQAGIQSTYAQSKLALTMWSFHLAKELNDVRVIAVNPGSLLDTRMVREGFGRVWSSADKGGDILYDLAVSEKYEGITGKYFDNDRGSFGRAHGEAYNEGKINKLIQVTDDFLKLQG